MRLLHSRAPEAAPEAVSEATPVSSSPELDAALPTQRTASPGVGSNAGRTITAPADRVDAEVSGPPSATGRGLLVGALPTTSGLPASLGGPRTPTPLALAPKQAPIAPPLVLLSLRRRLALATAGMVIVAVAGAGMTVAAEQRAATQAAIEAHAAVIAAQQQVFAAEQMVMRDENKAASWAQTLAKQTAAAAAGVVVLDGARLALAGAPQAGDDVRGALQASIDAASAVVTAAPTRSVLTTEAAVATVDAPLQAAVAAQAAWQVAEDARLAAERAAAEAAAAQAATAAKAAAAAKAATPRATTTTRKATTTSSSGTPAAAAPAPASNAPEFSAGELGGAINAFRASQGLGALSISRSSSLVAHASAMAQAGDIWHSGGDKIVGYVQPSSASSLVQAWANSPGHRAWMVKTTTSAMQVGAVVLNGRLYGAVNFT